MTFIADAFVKDGRFDTAGANPIARCGNRRLGRGDERGLGASGRQAADAAPASCSPLVASIHVNTPSIDELPCMVGSEPDHEGEAGDSPAGSGGRPYPASGLARQSNRAGRGLG
ncbi:hypothetical protein [Bosea thiooxidans]